MGLSACYHREISSYLEIMGSGNLSALALVGYFLLLLCMVSPNSDSKQTVLLTIDLASDIPSFNKPPCTNFWPRDLKLDGISI